MNQEPNSEAAETVQTTNVPAVDLPRLVLGFSECKGPTHYAGCACHEKGWKNKWECAVEMAAQSEAKLAIIMDVSARLNDYVRAGGMICEPTSVGDYWELGRNLGPCYCIDGQGDTLMECLLSVSRDVWHEVSSENATRSATAEERGGGGKEADGRAP